MCSMLSLGDTNEEHLREVLSPSDIVTGHNLLHFSDAETGKLLEIQRILILSGNNNSRLPVDNSHSGLRADHM